MEARDRQFLDKMWSKAEEKEENEKLAETIVCNNMDAAESASGKFGHSRFGNSKYACRMPELEKPQQRTAVDSERVFAALAENGTGMTGFFRDMFRGIGMRQIYAGMADVLCISFAVTFCVLYLLMQSTRSLGVSMDAAVFGGSPLLYVCLFLLFWVKDAQSGVYGLQMSCKYTFFHILAARMFAASVLGMGCNGLYVLVLILRYQADGLRLGAISFSALACFSVLLMAGIEKGRRFGWAAAVCGGWAAVNLTAFFCFADAYGELLGRIPVYVFLAGGAGCAALYFRQLLFMTTLGFRKEYSDASN